MTHENGGRTIVVTAAEAASVVDTASQAHHIAAAAAAVVDIGVVDHLLHMFQGSEVAAWVGIPAGRVERVPAPADKVDKAVGMVAGLVDKVDRTVGPPVLQQRCPLPVTRP